MQRTPSGLLAKHCSKSLVWLVGFSSVSRSLGMIMCIIIRVRMRSPRGHAVLRPLVMAVIAKQLSAMHHATFSANQAIQLGNILVRSESNELWKYMDLDRIHAIAKECCTSIDL
ncbi:hypothetical protein VNO77_27545 [Canavalia gladiata]|uniref:Uncharacterized protein n=1 Tax=Canavalia gladiata TaxID=3824 RepID=A0AAN9Q762_CANGL